MLQTLLLALALVGGAAAPSGTGASRGTLGPVSPNGPSSALPGPAQPLIFTVQIPGGPSGTQTGYKERFVLTVPSQEKPRPLVVLFHRFGVGELGPWIETELYQEAWARGWHVVAPLSASNVHFNSPEGQRNTETAIEWTVNNFNVDTSRIYGIGFSMGGGMALSYAAHHVDPARPMFAAVVDHTGGVSLNDTYVNAPGSQFVFDFWYGDGTQGSADPWKMTAASLFDFDPNTLVVDTTSDMARNLKYMPTKVFRVEDDPLTYLQVQCDVAAAHLAAQGTQTAYEIVPGNEHNWDSLAERKTFTWLSKKRLTLPTAGQILADGDGKYFHLTLQQTAPGAFSSMSWSVNAAANRLFTGGTQNLTQVKLATLESGLNTANEISINMNTGDPVGVEYVISDWPSAPAGVTRDGSITTAFTYDAGTLELTLHEVLPGNHDWRVFP